MGGGEGRIGSTGPPPEELLGLPESEKEEGIVVLGRREGDGLRSSEIEEEEEDEEVELELPNGGTARKGGGEAEGGRVAARGDGEGELRRGGDEEGEGGGNRLVSRHEQKGQGGAA